MDHPDWISWHTCMRSIYLSDERILEDHENLDTIQGFEIYRGFSAYSFLVEVVCGLHSKLYGESEIQAQFRDRFSPPQLGNSAFELSILRLRDQVLEHSKIIRTQFLTGIGRMSYGSLAETWIRGFSKVHLFGTGNLAESLLPYLVQSNRRITVYGRNVQRLEFFESKFDIQIKNWESYSPDSSPVIIASTYFPESILETMSFVPKILDFREDFTSRIACNWNHYIPFSTMLHSIQNTQKNIIEIKPQIVKMISHLTHDREEEQTHFLNGWEDLTHTC